MMHLDTTPSTSRIFSRPRPTGLTLYVEVRDLGVLVVPVESVLADPRGRLSPRCAKLLSAQVLDRLAQTQTPLLPSCPPEGPP